MGNAYREGETLMYDHLHRRSMNSEGLDAYPENVLYTHENFTYGIMESSAAKVDIVYGKRVQNRILQRMKMTSIPLWGPFEGVFLFLLHEDNFQNQEKDYMFRKVLLFVTHPQRMLYLPKMDISAILQDRTLEVAVRITDPSIKFNPKYYQTRAWEYVVSMSRKARQVGNSMPRKFLYSLQAPVNHSLEPLDDVSVTEPSIKRDTWNAFFNPKPHSNRKTRSVLPEAIKAIEVDKEEEWEHPSQFHPAVAAWLKGQKEVLFYCGPILCAKDIISTVENYKTPVRELAEGTEKGHQIPRPSLRRMLRQLMLAQQKQLGSVKPCKHDDLLYNRLGGEAIKVSCPCGLVKFTDTEPRFSCARPSAYVARERKCHSSHCNPKSARRGTSQILRPISNDLEFVLASVPSLRAKGPRRIIGERLSSLIRAPMESPTRPVIVESWCIVCEEKTEIPNGSSVYIDTCARWTIGNVRPLYVERMSHCLRCKRMTGKVGRSFIPKSPEIPSISSRRLARFSESYQNYDRLMQAALLDSYLPSPRAPGYLVAAEDSEHSDVEDSEHDDIEDFKHSDSKDEPTKDCLEEERRKPGMWELELSLDAFSGPPNPSASGSNSLTEVTHRVSSGATKTKEQKMRKRLRLPEHAKPLIRLIRDPSNCSHLPTQVGIWCQTCKEDTKVSITSTYKSEGNWLIDTNPKWTIGEPPTYIGTKVKCLNCSKTRFVAMDRTIPSINSGDLREWADRNANLSNEEVLSQFEKRTAASIKRMVKLGRVT